MMQTMSGKLLPALALASLTLTACSDDTEARLTKALGAQGVKSVKVTEDKVTATCASGATVEVPASELERNFLGMAKAAKVTSVGKKLLQDCDTQDKEKAREAAAKAGIADEAKRLGIDLTGLDDENAKKAICEKLTADLPTKDPERTVDGLKNTQKWGCAPPPPPAALPTGAWAVELGKAEGKKPATSYLRLQNDDGARLTVRCPGKKPDLYVQPREPIKKGTKLVEAKVGGGKPAKWKVKPSTDGKALFFPDTKAAFKQMATGDELALMLPDAKSKKPNVVTFPIKGFADAIKQLPKACQ
jgi:hypothetical protein